MGERTIHIMSASADIDAPPTIDQAIAFLRAARAGIPAEYRSSAQVYISGDYDAADRVSIWYGRLETVSEREERESAERAAEERRRIRLAMIERAPTSWWADADPVNFARYKDLLKSVLPGMAAADARVAFHHAAVRIHAGASKPEWWVDTETEG